MEKKVILVNEKDEVTGTAGKMEAHSKGMLHRAFSIFVFNKRGEMLLQRRALDKYHSGGLWTNTCCSHPEPGEATEEAATKRLKEEMGFETPIARIFDFVYRARLDNGLTEYEFDHVFAGEYEGPVPYNPSEVMDIAFTPMEQLEISLNREPGQYTEWFRVAFPRVTAWWRQRYQQNVA
jgi:isopentenyl-diphosphate delta-isomerase